MKRSLYNKACWLMGLLQMILTVPVLGQYDFTVSTSTGCTPLRVKFQFTPMNDTITSFKWDFGNGQTSTLQDPDSVTYSNGGTYSPSLVYNDREDLKIEHADLITVHHTVAANFNYHDSVSYNTYVFEHSESLDPGTTYTYLWDFEEAGTGSNPRETVVFPEPDTFYVTLTVTDNFGCSSTKGESVFVLDEIIVQNVFTPNGDTFNDFFLVSSNGAFPLIMRIFTRAGILVYESEGSSLSWDGYTASGQELSTGIYFYTIDAKSGDPDKRYSKAGFLYMYR